jgi:tetratricopeptide (TPR) repeat protein
MPEGQSSMELRYNMGVAHGTLAGVLKKADTRNAKEQADEAFAQACNCYSEIVEEDPAHADALNNWGAMLSLFAEGISRDSALTFLSDACDKLTRANELAPADFEVLNNHADALASWAELLSTDASGSAVTSGEVDALWQRAYDVYARVLELAEYDCDKVNCLCNWNDALQAPALPGECPSPRGPFPCCSVKVFSTGAWTAPRGESKLFMNIQACVFSCPPS